jgi:homoaconitase/3-isopropylmalate dehydratase large subunit
MAREEIDMGLTYVQKLLARACGRDTVAVGDILELPVSLAMSHENAALVINQFKEIYRDTGLEARVWDPDRITIIFDHRVPAESSKTATNHKRTREFVAQQGITKFHDVRGDVGGICHQILPENGSVHLRLELVLRKWRRSGRSVIFSMSRCRVPSRWRSMVNYPQVFMQRT